MKIFKIFCVTSILLITFILFSGRIYSYLTIDLLFECGEDVSERLYSDDKKYFAVWVVGSCGATTSFVTSVYIQKASEKFNLDKYGRIVPDVFADFRGKREIKLTWDKSRVIIIDSTNQKISCLYISGQLTSC